MKLAVPDFVSPSYFPAVAAVELGFFKAEGLDVEFQHLFPVDAAYRALRDGTVDFVGGSAHAALAETTMTTAPRRAIAHNSGLGSSWAVSVSPAIVP